MPIFNVMRSFCFLLTAVIVISHSQVVFAESSLSSEDEKAIKEDTLKLYNAPFKGDFKTVIKLMHPNAIASLGGEEKVVSALSQAVQLLDITETKLLNVKISGPLQTLKTDKDFYVFIPIESLFKNGFGQEVKRFSFHIGSRVAPEQSWKYIAVSQKDILKLVQQSRTDIPKDYKFPKIGREVVEK